jgi:phage-related protein
VDWQIEFYIDKKGNAPVNEFILTLPKKAIAEIFHVLDLLVDFNLRLAMPYVRKIDKSGLRELRIRHGSDSYRIFYFTFTQRKFVLLHAFAKKGAKTPEGDKLIALKRMDDYKSRR